MSWESTIPYRRRINERVRERLGGLHSAELVLYSVDFAAIEELQHRGDWDAAAGMLAEAVQALQRAGAEAVILGCNEIGLFVGANDSAVPLFDTTAIHAEYAADWALAA